MAGLIAVAAFFWVFALSRRVDKLEKELERIKGDANIAPDLAASGDNAPRQDDESPDNDAQIARAPIDASGDAFTSSTPPIAAKVDAVNLLARSPNAQSPNEEDSAKDDAPASNESVPFFPNEIA